MALATQRAAELQVLLEGVPLPASKQELVDYAGSQAGGERFLADLRSLPDREYRALDEVGEELAPAQAPGFEAPSALPYPESGLPPGGDDYVRAGARSGAVRVDAPPDNPPKKAIEEQTKTQKKQQERRERGG
jgi:Protein of unknown function (DUF2795)